MTDDDQTRLTAYVGSYASGGTDDAGGITVLTVSPDGEHLSVTGRVATPQEAGYLVHSTRSSTLYAVDERKTDGRGPTGPAAAVHSFAVDPADGSLRWTSSSATPGAFPTYLAVDEDKGLVFTANHGSFDHVERVVVDRDGGWHVEYVYDDSTVVVHEVDAESGVLTRLSDVQVLTGHGADPNDSLQAGGHGQASAHAHCAVLDPSGDYLLVADKGTDQILVFHTGPRLKPAAAFQAPRQTGPRHIAFDPATGIAYVTYEFSSELASLRFDPRTGDLYPLDRVSTVAGPVGRTNEPADVRVHPRGGVVYVNNRGEDSLAWFSADGDGRLLRRGHVALAPSVHPGLAARSFVLDPRGRFLLLADRPAGLVRSFRVAEDGSLTETTSTPVPEAACVCLVGLPA